MREKSEKGGECKKKKKDGARKGRGEGYNIYIFFFNKSERLMASNRVLYQIIILTNISAIK